MQFLQQDYNFDRETLEARALNVREHLGRYAESVRRNVESEIACTEMKFLNASRAFMAKLRQEGDAIIAQALELRDAEVNDLISIGTEAVRCQEDKARISQLTDRLQSQQVLFITLHDMSLLHRELVRYYGMRTAIEA